MTQKYTVVEKPMTNQLRLVSLGETADDRDITLLTRGSYRGLLRAIDQAFVEHSSEEREELKAAVFRDAARSRLP